LRDYKAINVGENYEKRKTDITPWLEYFVKIIKQVGKGPASAYVLT
jgi:hypothetical protein